MPWLNRTRNVIAVLDISTCAPPQKSKHGRFCAEQNVQLRENLFQDRWTNGAEWRCLFVPHFSAIVQEQIRLFLLRPHPMHKWRSLKFQKLIWIWIVFLFLAFLVFLFLFVIIRIRWFIWRRWVVFFLLFVPFVFLFVFITAWRIWTWRFLSLLLFLLFVVWGIAAAGAAFLFLRRSSFLRWSFLLFLLLFVGRGWRRWRWWRGVDQFFQPLLPSQPSVYENKWLKLHTLTHLRCASKNKTRNRIPKMLHCVWKTRDTRIQQTWSHTSLHCGLWSAFHFEQWATKNESALTSTISNNSNGRSQLAVSFGAI